MWDALLSLIISCWCGPHQAFSIISVLRENSDIHPTLPVYNNLLKACIRMKNLKYASECLQLMKQDGVGKNIITYIYLLEVPELSIAVWTESVVIFYIVTSFTYVIYRVCMLLEILAPFCFREKVLSWYNGSGLWYKKSFFCFLLGFFAASPGLLLMPSLRISQSENSSVN